ncbi:hypothetical protein ACFSKW_50020, partial [Nonomuraea mangrovi]
MPHDHRPPASTSRPTGRGRQSLEQRPPAPPSCRTRAYRDGVVVAEGFPIADVSDHLADPACTVWFDLCTPTPAELGAISEELGLHELAVEDVL